MSPELLIHNHETSLLGFCQLELGFWSLATKTELLTEACEGFGE